MFRNLPQSAAQTLSGLSDSLWSTGAQKAIATPGSGRWSKTHQNSQGSDDDTHYQQWDLIGDRSAVNAMGAQLLTLFGDVMDFDGTPQPNVRVDIWQAGPDGKPTEPGQDYDQAFLGHGWVTTGAGGHYLFRTILPVACNGRAPHIAARVSRPNGRQLDAELFLVDAPENDRDWNYCALGPSQQAAVSIDPVRRPDGSLEAGFNFVV